MAITKTSKNSIATFTKYDNTAAANYPSQFLAVGPTGTVLTSPDGITWTARTTGLPAYALAAPHRAGAVYAVYDNAGYKNRYISADGITWAKNGMMTGFTNASAQAQMVNAKFNDVDKTVNVFANMVGLAGNWGQMFDVTNGVAQGDISINLNNWGSWDYATNGSVFLFAGGNPAATGTAPYLLKSTTTKGGAIVTQAYGSSSSSYGAAYGAGLFVVTASDGTGVYTSPDAVTWTSRGQTSRYLYYANGVFFLYNGNILATSTDAITWNTRTLPGLGGNGVRAVAYGAGLFVVVCEAGLLYTSPDGVTFTSRTSGTASAISGVYYG
jgi:hypothetical protein